MKWCQRSRIISSVNETISCAYNLDDAIASITYPSGKTITYTVGNAERLAAILSDRGVV
jgi:hypothetical protein